MSSWDVIPAALVERIEVSKTLSASLAVNPRRRSTHHPYCVGAATWERSAQPDIGVSVGFDSDPGYGLVAGASPTGSSIA